MKTFLILCLLACVIIVSSQPAKKHAKAAKHAKHVAHKKVAHKPTDKKAELAKYKKLYAINRKEYNQLSLKQWKVDLENQQKWIEFQTKWLSPKGKDAKKLKKQKAAEEKKLRLEEEKRWKEINKEELKLSKQGDHLQAELKKLMVKPKVAAVKAVKGVKADALVDEVNDPKKKTHHKKAAKKAAKAKSVKPKKAHEHKQAKATKAKVTKATSMNEWSNGWDNGHNGNMETYGQYNQKGEDNYGSYYKGSDWYDEEETL